MNLKKWFENLIYQTIEEHTSSLFTVFKLIDEDEKIIDAVKLINAPLPGSKIIIESNVFLKPKLFIVKEVYISNTGFAGILVGQLKEYDLKDY